jgi:hypothetical protein
MSLLSSFYTKTGQPLDYHALEAQDKATNVFAKELSLRIKDGNYINVKVLLEKPYHVGIAARKLSQAFSYSNAYFKGELLGKVITHKTLKTYESSDITSDDDLARIIAGNKKYPT